MKIKDFIILGGLFTNNEILQIEKDIYNYLWLAIQINDDKYIAIANEILCIFEDDLNLCNINNFFSSLQKLLKLQFESTACNTTLRKLYMYRDTIKADAYEDFKALSDYYYNMDHEQ